MRGSTTSQDKVASAGGARTWLSGAALLLGCVALLGCGEVVPFFCNQDSQCVSDGAGQGKCEPEGFCSFPDASCDSGRSYAKHAQEDLSEMCVPRCIEEITLGAEHGCMRMSNGSVKCWGDNAGFKLGLGVMGDDHVVPTTVANLRNITGLGAGDDHTCVISGPEGRILCWGHNDSGQLSSMSTGGSAEPVEVRFGGSGQLNAAEVAGGRAHTCARTNFMPDTVLCWGNNESCQLGIGRCQMGMMYLAQSPIPVDIEAPQNFGIVRELALGGDDTCVLLDDGKAACWGNNEDGQICGAPTGKVSGTLVAPMAQIDVIEHSGANGCHVVNETVQCCGKLDFTISLPLNVDSLAAGESHVCALADGRVFCGGQNMHGQLGQGHFDTEGSASQVEVLGLPPVVQLEARGSYTCALTETGQVFCWGDNVRGQVDPYDSAEAIATPTESLTSEVSCMALEAP